MISRIITSLREQIKRSLSRFPLAYGLLVVLVAVLLTNELTPQWLSSAQFTLAWTFSLVGFLIALAVELIRENQVLQSMRWILEGVVLLLWMGMAAWASRHPGIGTIYMIASVALSAQKKRPTRKMQRFTSFGTRQSAPSSPILSYKT